MYSGYGGSPSRTLSTMSLSIRPVRRLTSVSITRSQSFTGVNTSDKSYRNLSVFNTPGLSRKPSRASRMFTLSTKSNPPPKVPQPERLDQVYTALKNGLQSCLHVHQMDLESLSRQMKESKRNSRLGFLYEVDKQVKVTERYIRRLEFHLSKIEELYDAYCMQRRLRAGADRMVKAYTESQGSKEARESLSEANRGFKEYTENMCVLESDFEAQLGEFHIKMRGLAGFARLCAGDQYEIFMKYGRQRWKLRGRIEINAKQVWDSEEIVFLPLINEFLSVKVTELKSLANHVTVGNVSCETKDLFAALPQTVAVDINDLGTIKLNLEITWNPFDKEDQGSISSTVKAPSVSKRFSTIFNQSPPDTPSLREQVFYNMLRRREELENGTAWSNSSESSDDSSSPLLCAQGLRSASHQTVPQQEELCPPMEGTPTHAGRTSIGSMRGATVKHKRKHLTADGGAPWPETKPAVSESSSNSESSVCRSSSTDPLPKSHVSAVSEGPDIPQNQAFSHRYKEKEEVTVIAADRNEVAEKQPSTDVDSWSGPHLACRYSRSLSHISESSADSVATTERSAPKSGDVVSLTSGISVTDIEMEVCCRIQEPLSSEAANAPSSVALQTPPVQGVAAAAHVAEDHPTDCSAKSQTSRQLECNTVPEGGDGTYRARRVQVKDRPAAEADSRTAAGRLDSGLKDALEAVVSSLDDYRGQFPELQLLEHELKLLQVTLKGGSHSRSPSVVSLTVETALGSFDFLNTSEWEEEEEEEEEQEKSGKRSQSGRSLRDRGWDTPSPPTLPLTTGCAILDSVLIVHLKYCTAQLLCLGTFGPLRCREMYALDKLLREAQILQFSRCIIKDNPQHLRHPEEVIPQLNLCLGAASLWEQCVGQGSVYTVSAQNFLLTLSTVYGRLLRGRANAVSLCLLERVLDQRLPRRGGSRDNTTLTIFQLWSYLESVGVRDLEAHVQELAEEVSLVTSLASCEQDVVIQALRRPAECGLRRDGLQAVAKLLKDSRSKVSALASSLLRDLAAQPRQRQQALVSCMELLEEDSVDIRVCGCKALACLKAKESINQLVYLCQTDKEEVRDAAKQTLLLLGEEGMMAHRHVELSQESLPRLFAPGSLASTAF